MLLDQFESSVKLVGKDIRPFMFPMIIRLATLFEPGMKSLTWTSPLFEDYFKNLHETIKDFTFLSFQ